jgi:hypothetical protein
LFERPEVSQANSNLRMSMLHWASDPDLRGDELIQAIKEEYADPHALLSDCNLFKRSLTLPRDLLLERDVQVTKGANIKIAISVCQKLYNATIGPDLEKLIQWNLSC